MFSRLPSYSIAIIKVYHIISYIYYIIFILKLNQHHWSFYRMVLDLSTPSRTDVTWYLIKFGVVWDIHMMWLHASNATIQSRNRVDRFSATELLADPWLSGGARLEVMCLRHLADGKHFVCLLESRVACVLLGMCPNPAAVRMFRNCASKGFLLMVLLAREDKRLLFYGFQRWREALFRRAFCLACARILLLFECFATCASKGFLLMVLLAREDKRLLFYGFQRWREALFRRAFCLACARILLLFECFATAPPRDFC